MDRKDGVRWSLVVMALTLFSILLIFPKPNNGEGAETYPSKSITCIVPAEPGGKDDILIRAVMPFMKKYLGGSILITNVPGASKKIGMTKLWGAKPDGYTIGQYSLTALILMENYYDDISFKAKEFSQVYGWAQSNQTLVVNAQRWKNLDEFLKHARSNQVSAGVAGLGLGSHLAALIVAKELDLKRVTFVPFNGAALAVSALAGNHIDFATLTTVGVFPMVRAGQLRPLIILSDQKDNVFPDVPIPEKIGLSMTALPSIDGIAAPPGTPAEVIRILENALSKAVKEPKFIEWAQNTKTQLIDLSSKQFRDLAEKQEQVAKKYKEYLRAK